MYDVQILTVLCINRFDGSEKRPLTKMLWSVSIKTRTFASVNTCNGSFLSCFKASEAISYD